MGNGLFFKVANAITTKWVFQRVMGLDSWETGYPESYGIKENSKQPKPHQALPHGYYKQ